jgi:hypothetical protein
VITRSDPLRIDDRRTSFDSGSPGRLDRSRQSTDPQAEIDGRSSEKRSLATIDLARDTG